MKSAESSRANDRIADAYRCEGKRFVVRADELLTAFLEMEAATDSDPFSDAQSGKNLVRLSRQFSASANRRFQFHKHSQLFIGVHNETFSVAVCDGHRRIARICACIKITVSLTIEPNRYLLTTRPDGKSGPSA
jgi:hypothetical protein